VTRFNPSGSALVYSTYLGGYSTEWGNGIAVDGAGNAYITGLTDSTDFPTVNAFQPNNAGGGDAFVTKFNPNGSALVYSTYLGGSYLGGNNTDYAHGIAIDTVGNAYVTGETPSANFPVVNPYQANNAGGLDAFVTKIYDVAGPATTECMAPN